MQRILSGILMVLGLLGASLTYFGTDSLPELPFPGSGDTASQPRERRSPAAERGFVMIGAFNIQVFGQSKSDKPEVMQVLAEVARKFDVLAIQEIRSREQDVLPRFVELINSTGLKYDYAISPRLGRTSSKEQYAYVYDTESVVLDRDNMYVVGDPDDRMHREPFVGLFAVKGIPPEKAFTFSLVNIHTDPDEVDFELAALYDVFWAVRADGQNEDDIILLGDLNASEEEFGPLAEIPNLMWAITGKFTNTRLSKQYDNILFDELATIEYSGNSGVMNLMEMFDLTEEQALQVSDHLPVWAEFSVYEGGAAKAPPIASRPVAAPR